MHQIMISCTVLTARLPVMVQASKITVALPLTLALEELADTWTKPPPW